MIAVLHPKGGVGRSTTVWQLGAELALRGRRVRIEDRDQARHLSRMAAQLPPVPGLRLAGTPEPGELLLVDTAPEGSPERTLPLLRESNWVIAPAKPEPAEVLDDRLVHQVAIADIRPSVHNPRRAFDGIENLAASLADHGLLQPIVVRRLGPNTYELIAGHRRLKAAKQLGWTLIAAVVRDETEDQAYILTLVENLQREDLKPREEAAALLELERRLGSAVAVARAIKRSEAYVSKRKRVYQDVVLGPAVLTGGLPVTTAEELLGIPSAEDRQKLAARAQREAWDRPRVRAAVRTFAAKDGPAARAASRAVSAGVDEPRSRAVVRQVQELRRLLQAGSLGELSGEAADALRAVARELNDYLPGLL